MLSVMRAMLRNMLIILSAVTDCEAVTLKTTSIVACDTTSVT